MGRSIAFWISIISLLLILIVFDSSLMDPTQPLKQFLLFLFCLLGNFVTLFYSSKMNFGFFKKGLLISHAIYLIGGLLTLTIYGWDIPIVYEWSKMFLFFNLTVLLTSFLVHIKDFKIRYFLYWAAFFQLIAVGGVIYDLVNLSIDIKIFNTKEAGGLFFNSNLCSQLLFLSLPFTTYGAYCEKAVSRKSLFILSSSLSFLFILILGSKAVLLALLIMVLTCLAGFIFIKKVKHKKIGKSLVVGTVIFILLGAFSTTQLPFVNNTDSFKVREKIWLETIASIKDKPLVGHGLGSWFSKHGNYALPPSKQFDIQRKLDGYSRYGVISFIRPHNDFLWVWSEIGFISFLGYLFIFLFSIYYGLDLLLRHKGNEKFLPLLLLSTLIGFIIISLFSFPKERIEQLIFVSLITSILLSKHFTVNKISTSSNKYAVKFQKLGIALSIAICLFFSYLSYQKLVFEKKFTALTISKNTKNWKGVLFNSKQALNTGFSIGMNGTSVHWHQGLAAINLNQVEKSHAYFKAAYKLQANHLHTLSNLATTYMYTDKPDSAKYYYERALFLDPNFDEARINLSAIHFNKGEIDKAYLNITNVYYQTENEYYNNFIETIFKAKFENYLTDLAQRNQLEEHLVEFYKKYTLPYCQLYKRATKEGRTMDQIFFEELEKINLPN